MIVLDTNVVAEVMRPLPDQRVIKWMNQQPTTDLWITAVTAGELTYGALRLPVGRRRTELVAAVEAVIKADFAERVLPYDAPAADHFGLIVADRERAGTPVSVADAQIASICRTRKLPLATRTLRDFRSTGIALINPWTNPA